MPDHHETIVALLADQFGVSNADIEANPTFDQLDCDSLDFVEVVMQVEDELGKDLDDSKFPWLTLPDSRKEGFRIQNPKWQAFRVNDFIAEVERQMASEVPSKEAHDG